ncbi:MAG: response regulator [Fulvivirga sp.]
MNSVSAKLVILIDDNEIDIFINRKVLEFNHFANRVMTYSSAREALDYLKSASEKDIPDLIFLDLNMPVVDGFRFLYEFTELPDDLRKRSGIVVLSSSNNIRDMEKIGLSPDVINFLPKPLTEEKLKQIRGLMKEAQYKTRALKPAGNLDELIESE